MVQMFTGRAELLDKGETTKEHIKNQKEEADRLELDKGNGHPTQGGLFGGLFKPKEVTLRPVIDDDDGVMRCPHCAWELEEGHCEGCGYQYRPGTEGTDDSESEDYSETDPDSFDGLDEEEPMEGDFEDMAAERPREGYFEDIDEQDRIWEEFALNHPQMQELHYRGLLPMSGQILMNRSTTHPALRHHMVPPNHPFYRPHPATRPSQDPYAEEDDEEDDEDDEGENEYDEADSFIDDEHNGVPTSSFIDNGLHDTSGEVYDVHSESDRSTGTVVDDVHGDPPSTDGLLQWRDTTPYIDEDSDESVNMEGVVPGSDESDEEDEEEEIRAVPPRRRHPHFAPRPHVFQAPSEAPWLTSRATIVPDSDEEAEESSEESESESSPPPRRPAGRATSSGTTARNAITLDDSDDDDHPVGPVRRNTHRRHNRFSPY
jgi:hypothetical protein